MFHHQTFSNRPIDSGLFPLNNRRSIFSTSLQTIRATVNVFSCIFFLLPAYAAGGCLWITESNWYYFVLHDSLMAQYHLPRRTNFVGSSKFFLAVVWFSQHVYKKNENPSKDRRTKKAKMIQKSGWLADLRKNLQKRQNPTKLKILEKIVRGVRPRLSQRFWLILFTRSKILEILVVCIL